MASPEIWTSPVNKNAAAEKAKLTLESVIAEGWTPEGFNDTWLERNIENHNKLIERLSVPEGNDWFIRDFVTTEMERYFQGALTAEQSAKNLQSRLNTYLQE